MKQNNQKNPSECCSRVQTSKSIQLFGQYAYDGKIYIC